MATCKNSPVATPDGSPVIDPTKNVLDLVDAAIRRQDDLRIDVTKLIDATVKRQDDALRLEVKRLDDLRATLHEAEEKLQELRSLSQKELMTAEAKRIDALLAAAAAAVGLASEKAAAQASALASQVITSAEALRAQVAASAIANNEAMAVLRDAMDKRITLLEQNQYRSGSDADERREGRSNNQWLIGVLVGGAVVVFDIIFHFAK